MKYASSTAQCKVHENTFKYTVCARFYITWHSWVKLLQRCDREEKIKNKWSLKWFTARTQPSIDKGGRETIHNSVTMKQREYYSYWQNDKFQFRNNFYQVNFINFRTKFSLLWMNRELWADKKHRFYPVPNEKHSTTHSN